MMKERESETKPKEKKKTLLKRMGKPVDEKERDAGKKEVKKR